MMLGDDTSSTHLLRTPSASADAVAAPAAGGADHQNGAAVGAELGSNNNSASEEDKVGRIDDGDRSFGGNRWPRQETLALLKIRSDMDQVFRDSSLKGPLWDEISRKLGELGYNRSAKKCKEKFENVYKYHKRTKDGRTGKPEGKHYKFFDQLQALDHHLSAPQHQPHATTKPNQVPSMSLQATTTTATTHHQAVPWTMNPPISSVPAAAQINNIITTSAAPNPIQALPQNIFITTTAAPTTTTNPTTATAANTTPPMGQPLNNIPYSFANVSANLFSSSTSSSTASEGYSEDQRPAVGTGTRKRKWKVFFKRLSKQVMRKQEELQDRFLEEIARRERERIVREESWRIQEMARINREHEILIQERSTAAAKDAAVIAFLQKISGGQQQQISVGVKNNNLQPPPPQLQAVQQHVQAVVSLPPPVQPTPQPPPATTTPPPNQLAANNIINYGENAVMCLSPSSSRWPKSEVQTLIRFRTELANKYQENGPKGPLWEEISAAMRSVGYNRNAKRCKEKWENINKYFKKVKESNKRRPGDSKTCPYFDQLDALYREKSSNVKAVNHNMAPLMVQPEQQWPLHSSDNNNNNNKQHQQGQNQQALNENDQTREDDEDEGDSEEDYEEDEEGGGGNNGGYEIVQNIAAAASASTGHVE